MSFNEIQKRVQRAVLGAAVGGALLFVPIGGCDPGAGRNDIGKLAFEVLNTVRTADAETVHDLRVAIRRFNQSVAVFGSLLPKREVKRIRKRLRRVMESAGAIRDRDIALEFLAVGALVGLWGVLGNLGASRRPGPEA